MESGWIIVYAAYIFNSYYQYTCHTGDNHLGQDEVGGEASQLIREIQFKQKKLESLLKANSSQEVQATPKITKRYDAKKGSIRELIEKEKAKYNRNIAASKESVEQLKTRLKELADDNPDTESYTQIFDSAFDDSTELSYTPQASSSRKNKSTGSSQTKEDKKFRDVVCEGCYVF
uniref:Uncharacterized protein n=1 Tax=Nyctotherus ovalis TaxID=70075 RepID=A6MI42_NYCOV|nr:hypothetical protein [Nyctotherus ovalis]